MAPWKRTFAAVWAANAITAIGMMAFLPFFPSHLEHLGLTDRDEIAAWAGVLYGAAPLAAALASPVWGVLGDRFGRRVMVVRSMLAITVFVGLMAFARTPWELLALRIGQGLLSGFIAPSITLVSVIAPPGVQNRTNGWLNSAMVLGSIVGPAVGEFLRHAVGLIQVYWAVSAGSALGAALVLAFVREERSPSSLGRDPRTWTRALRGALGDVRELRQSRALRAAVVLTFWIQFGLGATNPLLDLHVRDLDTHLAGIVARPGPLFSTMAVASLVCLPLWGRYGDRRGSFVALRRCAVACVAALALQAAATSYEGLLLGRIAFGAAIAGSATLAFGVAAAESPAERRGGAIGIVFSARAFAIATSSIVGGWLSAWTGVRGLFLASGLALIACLLVLRRGAPAGRSGTEFSRNSPQSVGGSRRDVHHG
jgi:DHA1 family multidrug resistance protein-like MFS transporter